MAERLVLHPTTPGFFRVEHRGRELASGQNPIQAAALVLMAEGMPVDGIVCVQHAGAPRASFRTSLGALARSGHRMPPRPAQEPLRTRWDDGATQGPAAAIGAPRGSQAPQRAMP